MQDEAFKIEAAKLWHWVANIARDPDFAELAEQSTATLLHPGFVGPLYPVDRSGTLVIGMNPGGGVDTPNITERKTLTNIREDGSVENFNRLNEIASKLFQSWPIWKNNLIPLLQKARVNPMSIAYIHAVPFRVKHNHSLNSIYKEAWMRVGSEQAALLCPGRILLAGKGLGVKLLPFMPTKAKIVVRSIGDKQFADRSAKISCCHSEIIADREFWA